jgi:hypothetical protein
MAQGDLKQEERRPNGAPNALSAASTPSAALRRVELFFFLTVWLLYGVALNDGNSYAFNLQQAGVEALVERGAFHLEGSAVPRLQVRPPVDVFEYEGHLYAAKQPGQAMLGACVYAVLRLFGLSYAGNYFLTSALVAFFTTSLVTALSAIALWRAARELLTGADALGWPLLAAAIYALGTTALAYSGIAHHDALAAGYIVIAFTLTLKATRPYETTRRDAARAACAGLFLGLAVTTSMLPFFMVVAVGLYFLLFSNRRLLAPFLAGGLAGLAPLLVFDAISFGNPLLLPNVAGNYDDTFFAPTPGNFLRKAYFYAWMLTLYAPVAWAGLAGLWPLTRVRRREALLVVAMLLALAGYIFNIGANGTCQYGPRYLIPAMPFACLGLAAFALIRSKGFRRAGFAVVAVAGLASFVINLVGALHGAMFCELPRYAFVAHLSEILAGRNHAHALARWLGVPLVLSAALLLRELLRERRARRLTAAT